MDGAFNFSHGPILWQSEDKTTTIIDVPTSIASAQDIPLAGRVPSRLLLSGEARESPFPSTEPKTEKAKANLRARMAPQGHDDRSDGVEAIVTFIRTQLEAALKRRSEVWYLPRVFSSMSRKEERQKRKLEDVTDGTRQDHDGNEEPQLLLYTPAKTHGTVLFLNASYHTFAVQELSSRLIHNLHTRPKSLTLGKQPPATYTIPPKSSFFLSRITPSTAALFSHQALKAFPSPTATAGPGQFDFILLDPPWKNRSATRSKAYEVTNCTELLEILGQTLPYHLAPAGYVAIWITNNSRSRRAAEDLFEELGVKLVEQWIWLKVTTKGEPVYGLEGQWRKPFEVLLVGKKVDIEQEAEGVVSETEKPGVVVRKRLLIAVPDIHSRKPCLKTLVEDLLIRDQQNYRALEIFARNLTTGWCSWGDEAIKFNWQGHWVDKVKESDNIVH